MKKIFIIIIFLSYFSLAKTSNINDFQIDGISLGDSLLDHYELSEVKKRESTKVSYPDSNYKGMTLKTKSRKFDSLRITYNGSDTKYIILSIAGSINFDNDIQGCKKKMKEILNNLENSYKDIKYVQEDTPYGYDKSGKSMTYGYAFYLDRGAIDLYCLDMSDEYRKKTT